MNYLTKTKITPSDCVGQLHVWRLFVCRCKSSSPCQSCKGISQNCGDSVAQCLCDSDAATVEGRQPASSHISAPVSAMCVIDVREPPSAGLRYGSADSGMTVAEATGFTSSPSHRYGAKLEVCTGSRATPIIVPNSRQNQRLRSGVRT